tara:strand:+ start:2349 stop:2789 length:441 start_codon:yes stop_codon:yes gene_type:complete
MSSPRDKVLQRAGELIHSWRICRECIPEDIEDGIVLLKQAVDDMALTAKRRASDPETSGQGPSPMKMTQGREQILRVFRNHPRGQMCDAELCHLVRGIMTQSGARSRRSELVRMGYLRDTTHRVRSYFDGSQHVQLPRAQTLWMIV